MDIETVTDRRRQTERQAYKLTYVKRQNTCRYIG